MNADERPAAKYGMPASESKRYEAAQTAIASERAVLKELRFTHALRVGPSLRTALDALAGKGTVPPSVKPLPPVVTFAPSLAPEPVDLRAALGLR